MEMNEQQNEASDGKLKVVIKDIQSISYVFSFFSPTEISKTITSSDNFTLCK